MCYFKLHTCPYPNQDPIAALIFLPVKAGQWEHCNKPKPWGRLSCGNLIVEHPKALTHEPSTSAPDHVLMACSSNVTKLGQDKDNDTSRRRRRSSTQDTIVPIVAGKAECEGATCRWCTAVVKLVGTKSKEIQNEARWEVARLEEAMDADAKLRDLHREMMDKEEQLDILRHCAWKRANFLLDGKAAENESPAQG